MIRHQIQIFIFTASLFLSGCTTAQPIIGPDGTENQLISCDTIEDCYGKANEVCRGPYKIVNTSSEVSGSNGATGTRVRLLVKCDH